MQDSPYKFLDFYSMADHNKFFGRERETNILVADILVSHLVVLFARTGTGKTSLINAGVRPVLEQRGFKTFYIRVEKDPTDAAWDELNKDPLLKGKIEGDSLEAQLVSVVNIRKQPIVLFFDQFEEFFNLIQDREARQTFVVEMAKVYEQMNSGVHIVFSMREEYYHQMDEFRSEIPSIFHQNSNLRLLPLDEDQARAAILKPAAALGVEFDLDLANEIIRDLLSKDLQDNADGIRAPSMQIICDTLWRREDPEDRHITLQDYEQLGRARSILEGRLAQDIEAAVSDETSLSLMQGLIPLLQTKNGTKYPREFDELVATLKTNPETLEPLTSRLKDAQIIKPITISGAEGIEWASDYLAERERSNLIENILKGIELKRILQNALGNRAKQAADSEDNKPDLEMEGSEAPEIEWPITKMKFEEIDGNFTKIKNLQANELELLLDTAMIYRLNMRDWFDRVTQTDPNGLELLRKRIHDRHAHINVRTGVIVLLGELGTPQALPLLEEALDEPDLSSDAVNTLIKFQGEEAVALLSRALERDDLGENILHILAQSNSERAVILLKPLLQRDEKLFSTLQSLEQLAKLSTSVGTRAKKALESALPILEKKLKDGSGADSARGALVRLSKFPDPLGSRAQNILSRSGSVPLTKQEVPSKTLSERIKDLVVRNSTKEISKKPAQKPAPDVSSEYFQDLMPDIMRGTVIPILSNSFRIDQIFRTEEELARQLSETADRPNEDELSIDEQLTKEWAAEIGYPLADDYHLAHVAQYYVVEQKDVLLSKTKYLRFLKSFLLAVNEENEEYQDAIRDIRTRDTLFSEAVRWLDLPRFPAAVEDPLRLLAKLPFPVYITTSYFNFLERALEAEGKTPYTHVSLWGGGRGRLKPEHTTYQDYEPTVTGPGVYHLYGLEDYPQTLVLSEDDFSNFFISTIEDTNTYDPVIPLRLREGLAESRLLFLGYRNWDLDFQTLLRFVSRYRRSELSPRGIIQFTRPMSQLNENERRSMDYLLRYFDRKQFSIEWTNPQKFILKLWNEWDKYLKGQI